MPDQRTMCKQITHKPGNIMNNRQDERNIDSVEIHNEPASQKTEGGIDVAQSTLFAGMFGSTLVEKISNFLMIKEGNFLFTTALFLRIAKLITATYNFVNNRNRNLSHTAEYGWTMLSGLALVAAIGGSILLATTFTLAAPIIFTAVFGADTVRNIFLTIWNAVRWGMLAYQVRGDENTLTQLKYEKLSSIYAENVKNHFIGSLIGLLGTAATVVIFLFPHIGLGAITTAAVLKTTVGGFLGIFSGVAFVAPIVLPKLTNLAITGYRKVKNLFNGLFSRRAPAHEEQQPLLGAQREQPNLVVRPKFRITNVDELVKASHHHIDHAPLMNRSKDRELLLKHINPEDPALALVAIENMVSDKIAVLTQDLAKKGWLEDRQAYKRRAKVEALTKIQDYLNFREVRNDENLKIDNVDALIKYIDRKYPEVDQSFFRNESDTRNILNALKAYEKFEKNDDNAKTIRRGIAA